jgi:serine/threonine protein kinase
MTALSLLLLELLSNTTPRELTEVLLYCRFPFFCFVVVVSSSLHTHTTITQPSHLLPSAVASLSTMSVKKIGKYMMGRTLGEGAFGKVKLGVHCDTQVRVAIKILKKELLTASNMIGQIKREVILEINCHQVLHTDRPAATLCLWHINNMCWKV